jgi:4-hydroxy-tetrahydrodipicolinate synthase
MLYDVPGRTGTAIAPDTYRRAAEWDTVIAVKDAVGDYARGTRIMRDTGLVFYSGDDANNLGWLAHGAAGFISVAGHACGDQLRRIADAWFAGDTGGALEAYRAMLPAIDAIMGVPNYGATTAKAALQLLGVLDNRNVRSPLVPLDDDELAALRVGLVAAHVL